MVSNNNNQGAGHQQKQGLHFLSQSIVKLNFES